MKIEEEFPFPEECLSLMLKLESEKTLKKEEIDIIDHLIRKYLNLRARLLDEN